MGSGRLGQCQLSGLAPRGCMSGFARVLGGEKRSIGELAVGMVNCGPWTVWRTGTLWKGSSHGRRGSSGVGKQCVPVWNASGDQRRGQPVNAGLRPVAGRGRPAVADCARSGLSELWRRPDVLGVRACAQGPCQHLRYELNRPLPCQHVSVCQPWRRRGVTHF